MCENTVQKISENCQKYVPKILEHGHGEIKIPDSESINKLMVLKAFQITDKSFCPLEAAAKSDVAFTIHKVCVPACMHACMRACVCVWVSIHVNFGAQIFFSDNY